MTDELLATILYCLMCAGGAFAFTYCASATSTRFKKGSTIAFLSFGILFVLGWICIVGLFNEVMTDSSANDLTRIVPLWYLNLVYLFFPASICVLFTAGCFLMQQWHLIVNLNLFAFAFSWLYLALVFPVSTLVERGSFESNGLILPLAVVIVVFVVSSLYFLDKKKARTDKFSEI